MFKILLLNGPNLNMLGTRQPEIYGRQTLSDIERACTERTIQLGGTLDCFQSNSEGALIDKIQQARGVFDAIVINPAGYSHTSIALMDALLACDMPVVEVHLSNIHRREEFRHVSYVSKAAMGVICGLGSKGYLLAIEAVASLFKGE